MSTEEKDQTPAISTGTGTALAQRYQPEGFNDMWRMAKMVTSSGLAPDSVRKPEDAMVIMMQGAELGLTAMAALRSIHVIKGKPSLSAKLQVALVRQLPQCEYFNCIEWNEKQATFETKRKGGEPVRFTFTLDDACRAQLTNKGDKKSNWAKYPKHMLWSRAASSLASAEYPEILSGLYTPDEAFHVGEVETVTTDDLNAKFSNKKPEPDEVVDAEFEELDDGEESDESADGDQGIIV